MAASKALLIHFREIEKLKTCVLPKVLSVQGIDDHGTVNVKFNFTPDGCEEPLEMIVRFTLHTIIAIHPPINHPNIEPDSGRICFGDQDIGKQPSLISRLQTYVLLLKNPNPSDPLNRHYDSTRDI